MPEDRPYFVRASLSKRLFAAALCGLLISGLALASCSQQPRYPDAHISLKSDKLDFGTIAENDPIAFHDASLIVVNDGEQPLDIERVELPEGFTYLLVPKGAIESGREATLRITMDTRKLSGAIAETAYLVSNDPTQPRISVAISATIAGQASVGAASVADAPDIYLLDNRAVNFGTLRRDDMVEKTFRFKNVGKKTLKIYSIETLCACVTGTPTMTEVPPGGEAAIIVKLEAWKYPGKTPFKWLQVKTNDPDEPVVDLSIVARIVDIVTLEPDTVLLPNIAAGHLASAEVKLIQGGKDDLVIESMETSSPLISAQSRPIEGEEKGYMLTVTVAPGMPEGTFDERVIIHTNYLNYVARIADASAKSDLYKNYKTLELPVKGSVTGTITVTPRTLNFGSGTPGETMERTLTVWGAGSSFSIESLTLSDHVFRTSYTPVEPGEKYEVTIQFLPEGAERQIEDKLTVKTTVAELTVPVYASVAPAR